MGVGFLLSGTCSTLFDAAGDCLGVGPDAQSFTEFCLMFPVLSSSPSPWSLSDSPRVSGPGWDNVSVDPIALDFNYAAQQNGAVAFQTLRHRPRCDVNSSFHILL